MTHHPAVALPGLPTIGLMTIAALGLSACAGLSDMRLGRSAPAASAMPETIAVTPTEGAPDMALAGQPSASAAEAACTEAGRERGFTVQGVVGSSDVTGDDGQPVSRDVMLRVARGAQVFDLRCSFHYPSGQARVMAL